MTDPDWLKINFANMRLGGGSSTRLMQLLRIEKGYTYGAGSWIGDYADTFTDADTSVTKNQVIKSNARAFETLDAKLRLLNRIAQQDLSHDIIERETAVLEGMSTTDFQQVIKDHMNESEMTWVIVGDAAAENQGRRFR